MPVIPSSIKIRLTADLVMATFILIASFQSAKLGWSLAEKFGVVVQDTEVFSITPPAAISRLSPAWGRWIDIASVEPQTKQAVVQKTVTPATLPTIDTSLNIVGLIDLGIAGVAIMQVNGAGVRVYSVGDVVDGDVFLASVTSESLMLSIYLPDGEKVSKECFLPNAINAISTYEKHELSYSPIKTLDAGERLDAAAQPITKANQDGATPVAVTAKPAVKNTVQVVSLQSLPKSEQANVAAVRKGLANAPLDIMREFQMSRVQVGRRSGLRVASSKYRGLLHSFGLRDSDIVLRINGKSVNDVLRSPQLWNSLLAAKQFVVDIWRDGQEKKLYMKL